MITDRPDSTMVLLMFTGCLTIEFRVSANGDDAGRYMYNFISLFCQQQ